MTAMLAVVMSAAVLLLASLRPEPPREARRPSELLAAVRAAGLGRCALGALVAAAGLGLLLLAEILRLTRSAADVAKTAADWLAAYIETLWADSQARRTPRTTLEVVK